jgi:hypothetical protein
MEGQLFAKLIDVDFVPNGFMLASDIATLFEEFVAVNFSITMSQDPINIYQNFISLLDE